MKHLTTTFYYVVVVNRCVIVVNPASNVGVFTLDDATPPKHVSHYDFLGGIVHICVCVMKIGITAVNSGFVTSKAAFYSGKSSQQRRGIHSRRRHAPPDIISL